jgi:hypothetical protein
LKRDLTKLSSASGYPARTAPWWVAAALVLMLAPGPASAKDLPAGGFTIDDVVAWLQGDGYKTEVVPASNGGTPHVHTFAGELGFGVYLYDCTDGRCGSIQFSAGYATHGKFDTSRMNQWNRDNRWCRGYFDSVNDPWIEMDVDLTPGGTYALLDDELATWKMSLKHFTDLYELP